MPILDANVILRYLLRDLPDKAEEARDAIMAGAATTAEVLAEVVYVLGGVYKADRTTIATALEAFIQEVEVPHKAALRYAFQLYGLKKLDFVDCVLAGYHHAEGMNIMTFDMKLQKTLLNDQLSQDTIE